MNNEITPEERASVISRLKYCPTFTDCYLSGVLSFNEDCDDIGCFGCHDKIRKKLIALIESATPGEKNMKASEFADKLEEKYNKTGSIYWAIAECLGYDLRTTPGKEDVSRLCDTIRNLNTPKSLNEIIFRPLDADGIYINFNDIVYYNNEDTELKVIGFKFIKDNEFRVIVCYGQNKNGYFDGLCEYPSNKLSHKKPRTLDDIINDMKKASYEERITLAREAYEMGRSAENEKAEEV